MTIQQIDGGEELVGRRAHAEHRDDALDDRQHRLGVVGEQVGDELLDDDAPQQRRREDEDLLLRLGDPARPLDRAHGDEVGGERQQHADADADQRRRVGADVQ